MERGKEKRKKVINLDTGGGEPLGILKHVHVLQE